MRSAGDMKRPKALYPNDVFLATSATPVPVPSGIPKVSKEISEICTRRVDRMDGLILRRASEEVN